MQPQNPELEAFIRRVPVFRDLPPPMFDVVRRSCDVRQYKENEYLFQQGEPTRGMFIIITGETALMQVGADGLKRQMGMIRAGQFVNQQALFGEGMETASLKAVLPTTALFLSRRDMSALMSYYKELPSLMGLASQNQKPSEIQFKTQRNNEQILLHTRRHPWAYARWSLIPVALMIGLLILGGLVPSLSCTLFFLSLVLVGGSSLYLYVEWANDAVIITDQRVVRINRDILRFTESINEVVVDSIQEARAEIPGTDPFAILFNYGTVDIRTGGQAGNFRLDHVPNPEAMQKLIMYDHQIRQRALQEEERSEMRNDLRNWVAGQPVVTAPTPRPSTIARVQGVLGSVETRADGSIIYRKHWIIWLRGTAPALLMIAGSLLLAIATLFMPSLQQIGAISWAISFTTGVAGALWLWYADWDWRHDYMLVQDSTITILHQRPFWLQNDRDQILLKQVDNVISETHGFTARLFGYGTIRLSLVGADQHKVFTYTPNPQSVQSNITKRQAALKQQEANVREQQEKERLGEYFQMYHEMMTGQDNPANTTPSSRPPSMKTGEVAAVKPAQTPPNPIPAPPAPAPTPDYWQPLNNAPVPSPTNPGMVAQTPPPPDSSVPNGRTPYGWTPPAPRAAQPPPAVQPPFVASGGQPDHNRPPRIKLTRPSLSPGKPYEAPRVDEPPQMPPPPPEMPPNRQPAPQRPSRFPRRLS